MPTFLLLAALPLALAGCRSGATAAATPPAPRGAKPPVATVTIAAVTPVASADSVRRRSGYTAADVAFMQGMIGHHAQALVMTAMLPTRTDRGDLHLLAERIAVSQRDEMAQMRQWLEARGEAVPADALGPAAPSAHAEHAAHADHARMPGMLSAAQLDTLAAARGTAVDRFFLRYMIQHHDGALVMVRELFSAPGAGQEPMLFQFASDVEADQRAEIRRMQALLDRIR